MSAAVPTPANGSMLRRIGAATFNYGLGSVLPQLIQFLLIPVFTAYLSPGDYGVLEVASVFSAALVLIMRLGVPGAVTRFYYDHPAGPAMKDYLTTVAWFIMIASFGVAALTLLAMPTLGAVVAPQLDYFPFVVLIVLSAFFSGNSDLQRRLLQAREQSGYSLRLNFVTSITSTILSVGLVVAFHFKATGLLLADLGANLFLFILAINYLKPDLTGRFRGDHLKSSLIYAVGILPSHLIGAVSPLVTRTLLVHSTSLEALGLFALASRFARPLQIVVTAFQSAYLPVYFAARATASEARRINRTGAGIWLLAVGGGLGLTTIAPPVIVLITPERFHPSAPIVPYLVLGGLAQMLYAINSAEIFYKKTTWLIPVIALGGAVTSIGLTVLLSDRLGATGLAIATSAGIWVNALGATWCARRTAKLTLAWSAMFRPLGLAAAIAVLVMMIHFPSPLWQLLGGAAACAAFAGILWIVRDPVLGEAIALAGAKLGWRKAA